MSLSLQERVGAAEAAVPTRVAALWVPDWPVLSAMTAADVPAHTPAAVHDGRRVVAVSALARSAGVRRGMRRRHAQECCPELVLLDSDPGRDARGFEPVAAATETVVSGIEIARPGLVLIPSRGAGRYHGSEPALAAELVGQVAERTGYEAQVGIADGSGAAVLAARAGLIVPAGDTSGFLAPLGIGELVHVATDGEVDELIDLLGRLGLRRLGDLAALPRADVLARFGRLGVWAHQVASGTDDRPPALRRLEPDIAVEQELDPPVERLEATAFAARRLAEALHTQMVARGVACGRLQITARTDDGQELVRAWRTDIALGGLSVARMTDRVRWQLEGWLTGHAVRSARSSGSTADPDPAPLVRLGLRAEQVVAAGAEQGRLWGGTNGADLRAQRAVHRVQGLIGAEAVLAAAVQGGREVRDQVHLVPWGQDVAPARPSGRPWPGHLPPPAPATVLADPQPVQVCDSDGRKVEVDARLQVSGDPAVLWWPTSPNREVAVTGWAGPWPVTQRWWGDAGARAVYLQVVLGDGRAVLLALREGVWRVEALYD